MQDGAINGPLNIKGVAAGFKQGLNYFLNAAFFPEPPKDQVGPIRSTVTGSVPPAACASITANFSQ
jgi:hypothetical protein